MNSTLLLVSPLALAACAGGAAVGGAATVRHFRHRTNYQPTVPLAIVAGTALATAAFFLLWAPFLVVFLVLLIDACAIAGAVAYVRSRWAHDFGVGEIGKMQQERGGIREYLRDRQEPAWRQQLRDRTRDELLDESGDRCVLGPEVNRREHEPTGRLVTVKLGKMKPGPGGNSGVVGLILGRPESGKTTTAIRLLHATAAADPQGRIIILDPKGDAGLRQCAVDIAAEHGTQFWEWGRDTPLDPLSNTVVDPELSIQAAVSRVMGAMEFTEPHYEGVAMNAYTDAAEILNVIGEPLSLSGMAQILSNRGAKQFQAKAMERVRGGALSREAFEHFAAWIKDQTKESWEEKSGAASRLLMLDRSGLGAQFAPAAEGARTISDMATVPGVSYLYLDAGMWPDAAKQVSELLAVALMQDVGRIAKASEHTITMFIDEVNAVPARRMDAMLMRGRSAGFSLYLASQTLSAIGATTPELTSQITGTLSWVIAHSSIAQSEGGEDDAERIGRLAGTRIERELTMQTSGGPFAMPTGQGSARQVHGYNAHPDTIRGLLPRHAVVIDVDQQTSSDTRSMLCGVTQYLAKDREALQLPTPERPQRLLEPGPALVPEIPYPERGWQTSPMRARKRFYR